ncbi:unnamed protein product [Phytophthora lilii]|uniref:Unnamed protein product n=1 Tax=Phytophthora lilii TaxID=2077276 RepID=A0A9W6YJW7_9STRA|nr:unnamed protein product [Phytophthora lilii]
MADTTSATSALLLDPGVAVLDDVDSIGRSAFSCSDLDKLVDNAAPDDNEEEEEDNGVPEQDHSASEESSTVTMVIVTLFFAGFLAVCGVLAVRLLRADEAAFARRLEQRTPSVLADQL